MKKFFILLFLPAMVFAATQPFKTFLNTSPSASALSGSELMYCDQSNTSTKCTPSQLLTYVQNNFGILPSSSFPALTGAVTTTAGSLTTTYNGIVPVAKGGNGTASPILTAGSGISLSGSWPNYTISATGGSTTSPAGIDASCSPSSCLTTDPVNISSVSYVSTGNYQVNFNPIVFTNFVHCAVSVTSTVSIPTSAVFATTSGYSGGSLNVFLFNPSISPTDGSWSLVCNGS
jgi:hypothetical protein